MEYPKILYIADVPIELSYAGATLMYRLLEGYPKNKLLIIQGMEVNSKGRLNGGNYLLWQNSYINRLLKSRLFRIGQWSDLLIKRFLLPGKLKRAIAEFEPDIVLTIPFRTSWVAAFQVSNNLDIPLHLILHDDLLLTENYGRLQPYIAKKFKAAYERAASRLCISPAMEEYYRGIYKISGDVLYPMRGLGDKNIDIKRNTDIRHPLCFCYAGSLNTGDFIYMLDEMAGILGKMNARLVIFSDLKKEAFQKFEHLSQQHVSVNGLIHPNDLRKFMLNEVDVNVLLNSFEHAESFKLNFSSKLVEYTIMSIPVLFWGSSTSGAISWAIDNNYELVSTNRDSASLYPLIEKLLNPVERMKNAVFIQKLGEAYFGYEKNFSLFRTIIEK